MTGTRQGVVLCHPALFEPSEPVNPDRMYQVVVISIVGRKVLLLRHRLDRFQAAHGQREELLSLAGGLLNAAASGWSH